MTTTAPAPRESGLGYMVQAAFWFAVMGLLVKLASRGLPTMQIVFVRASVSLTLAATLLWRAGQRPIGTNHRLLLLRGAVGSLAMICFYAAIVHLPLAEATVIQQTSPLFTALFAAPMLRERLDGRVLLGITVALVGVLLIARPDWAFAGDATANGHAWHYAFVALVSAVLSALAYISVRLLGRSENPLVVVFYFPLVTVPLTAPFAAAVWVWPDPTQWATLVTIGVVTQIAQVNMTKGLAREPAARATAVGYLQVAFATLFSAAVLGVWPDAWSTGGMLLILASLLLSTGGARQ